MEGGHRILVCPDFGSFDSRIELVAECRSFCKQDTYIKLFKGESR